MMLNKKKINFTKQDSIPLNHSFVQYPKISKDNFVQIGSKQNLQLGVNTVFNQHKLRSKTPDISNRFEYDSKQFREFFVYKSLAKKQVFNSNSRDLKRFFFFLNCILKGRKNIPFYLLKRIKGGYMVSVLGAICFVPRSLFKISLKQQLINLKLYKKSKKFARPNLKLNLVSSLLQKKP